MSNNSKETQLDDSALTKGRPSIIDNILDFKPDTGTYSIKESDLQEARRKIGGK